VARLCRVLRISRCGYCALRQRGASQRSVQDVVPAATIATVHRASDGTCGVPRIHAEVRDQGIRISRRRVAGLREGVSRGRSGDSRAMVRMRPGWANAVY
jgi:HTH-like domain